MARILVIDDDLMLGELIRRVLTFDHHQVITAASGVEGLSKYQSMRPDLVITDIIMPDKDGIEAIIEIRRLSSLVPVIAMSAGGRVNSPDFLKIALALGATAVLTKPFTPSGLQAIVKEWAGPRAAA